MMTRSAIIKRVVSLAYSICVTEIMKENATLEQQVYAAQQRQSYKDMLHDRDIRRRARLNSYMTILYPQAFKCKQQRLLQCCKRIAREDSWYNQGAS